MKRGLLLTVCAAALAQTLPPGGSRSGAADPGDREAAGAYM